MIEEPLSGDLDVCGWDLRKALRLLRRSNPALMEWLNSPVVYAGEQVFHEELRELAVACFSPLRCFRHYQSMAEGHARKYLAQGQVRRKKYLYALRPLLACRWIERGLGYPAMQLDQLIEAVLPEPDVRAALGELVSAKRHGRNWSPGPHRGAERFCGNRTAAPFLRDGRRCSTPGCEFPRSLLHQTARLIATRQPDWGKRTDTNLLQKRRIFCLERAASKSCIFSTSRIPP